MFTGLIRDIGHIEEIITDGDWTLRIKTNFDIGLIPQGASICCSGCCLTVTEKAEGSFIVQVSSETLSKTNIRTWQEGMAINLEPSLQLGDELGGHFVFGHVDGLAVLADITKDADSHRLILEVPVELAPFITPKGSVALDGVSLTVNEVEGKRFGVNIIPHTWEHTTLKYRKAFDALNIEIDMLARYVARQLAVKGAV